MFNIAASPISGLIKNAFPLGPVTNTRVLKSPAKNNCPVIFIIAVVSVKLV